MTKLNSMRLLDSQKVAYEVLGYSYDPDNPPDAVAVARQIGVDPGLVYKTLVVAGASHGRPLLVMIQADRRLDLKRLAAGVGQKRLEMAPQAEAERQTGLKVGGIGALALAGRRWPVYLDRAAEAQARVYVNAGQRGTMIGLAVADLLRVTGARWVECAV